MILSTYHVAVSQYDNWKCTSDVYRTVGDTIHDILRTTLSNTEIDKANVSYKNVNDE